MIETTRPIRVSLTNTRRHNLSQLALFTPGSSYSTQYAPDLYLITERERETFFIFRLCKQATYIIRAQDTVTALLQVQTIEGVGQLGGLKEL